MKRMFKGIIMLAIAFVMLTCGVFSGVMTRSIYVNDPRLPARFIPTHRININVRPGWNLNVGWFDPGE